MLRLAVGIQGTFQPGLVGCVAGNLFQRRPVQNLDVRQPCLQGEGCRARQRPVTFQVAGLLRPPQPMWV